MYPIKSNWPQLMLVSETDKKKEKNWSRNVSKQRGVGLYNTDISISSTLSMYKSPE